MIQVACGLGTNSAAMLIGLHERGITPDVILFADTGGERPDTYDFGYNLNTWCESHGFPSIVTVSSKTTLEEDCLTRKALPSIAYGFKSCSQRWKGQRQDKYMNNWPPAKEYWKAGGKITKYIGFDADEPQRARDFEDKKYRVEYPLIDWGWGRDECVEAISRSGLPQPGKSSCFFCPSMKPTEIRSLAATNPELIERALAIEENADLTSISGLGRNWAWKDLLATDDMFGDDSYIQTMSIDCGCYDG